jgi:hypothetical protein
MQKREFDKNVSRVCFDILYGISIYPPANNILDTKAIDMIRDFVRNECTDKEIWDFYKEIHQMCVNEPGLASSKMVELFNLERYYTKP